MKLENCSKANIIKYTPELIQAIKQMDEYSNQVTFLCKNKIQTEKDLIDFEKSINDKIKPLKCERESLWKKHKRAKTNEEKENIEQQIVEISKKLYPLNEDLKYCKQLLERIENYKDQQIKEQLLAEKEKFEKELSSKKNRTR